MASDTKFVKFFDKDTGRPNADRDGHFSYIEACVALAVKNNGKVFGGFVRDVIHPLSRGIELKTLNFKDIDIWFTTDSDAAKFVEEMGVRLVQNTRTKEFDITRKGFYKFGCTHYHIYQDDVCIAWMDIVISTEVPVDDFDVNTLCYNGGSFTAPVWYLDPSDTSSDVNTLVQKITEQKMTMKNSFITRLLDKGQTASDVADGRVHKFLRKGWSIVAVNAQGIEVPMTGTNSIPFAKELRKK